MSKYIDYPYIQGIQNMNISASLLGIIPRATTTSRQLGLSQIFRIAQTASTEQSYYLSKQWHEKALQMIGTTQESQGVEREYVLDHLVYAEFMVKYNLNLKLKLLNFEPI